MSAIESFTCPVCAAVSHNRSDVREGYCGACHDWTGTVTVDWTDEDGGRHSVGGRPDLVAAFFRRAPTVPPVRE